MNEIRFRILQALSKALDRPQILKYLKHQIMQDTIRNLTGEELTKEEIEIHEKET